jgi:hypothetical protein
MTARTLRRIFASALVFQVLLGGAAPYVSRAQDPGDVPDLQACMNHCRGKHRFNLLDSRAAAYYECIRKCEQDYWREFDARVGSERRSQ